MDRDEIIRKARKLAAFNAENATEAEVAIATAKLADMLERYQLSQADIAHNDMGEVVAESTVEPGTKSLRNWQKVLMACLGKGFHCEVISSMRTERTDWEVKRVPLFKLVGAKSDVAMVEYLYGCLGEQLRRMGYRDGKAAGYHGNACTGYINAYIIGGAHTVLARLREREKVAESDGRALVVVKNHEVKAYMAKHYPRLIPGGKLSMSNRDGYNAGRAAGHRVNLCAGIDGGRQATAGLLK